MCAIAMTVGFQHWGTAPGFIKVSAMTRDSIFVVCGPYNNRIFIQPQPLKRRQDLSRHCIYHGDLCIASGRNQLPFRPANEGLVLSGAFRFRLVGWNPFFNAAARTTMPLFITEVLITIILQDIQIYIMPVCWYYSHCVPDHGYEGISQLKNCV